MSYHGYVFTAPLILGLVLIFGSILGNSIALSFGKIEMGAESYTIANVGLENYKYVFTVDPDYIRTVWDTIISMVADLPIIIFFSLFIATLLNQRIWGKTFFRVIFFMPVIVATGIIAKADMNNYMLTSLSSTSAIDMGQGQATAGAIAQLSGIQTYLQNLSFSPAVTGYITGAVQNIYGIVNRSGVQILLFLSGLQSISPSIYEAAKVEGVTGWQAFWKITLPMLSPIVFVNTIYTIIDSFTRAENPIMDAIYSMGFKNSQYGIASAMAWVYMLVVAAVVAVIAAVMSRMIYYERKD